MMGLAAGARELRIFYGGYRLFVAEKGILVSDKRSPEERALHVLVLECSVGEQERHRQYVLVDENRISIGIDSNKAGWSGRGFVSFR